MNFDKNHVAHKKSIPAGTRIFRRISLTALKIFLVLLLFCVILGTAAGVGMIKGLIASAPNIDSLSVAPAESATYIYNTGNKPGPEACRINFQPYSCEAGSDPGGSAACDRCRRG